MIRALLIALAILTVAANAEAKKKVKPIPTVMTVFLGFSTEERTGASGLLNLHRACQTSQFGSNTRMCTTDELIHTPVTPLVGGNAWVMPTYLEPGLDATGASPSTCGAWTNQAAVGLAVNDAGAFFSVDCETPHPVACCGPRVIKVLPLPVPE